jgi:hypothetical protein
MRMISGACGRESARGGQRADGWGGQGTHAAVPVPVVREHAQARLGRVGRRPRRLREPGGDDGHGVRDVWRSGGRLLPTHARLSFFRPHHNGFAPLDAHVWVVRCTVDDLQLCAVTLRAQICEVMRELRTGQNALCALGSLPDDVLHPILENLVHWHHIPATQGALQYRREVVPSLFGDERSPVQAGFDRSIVLDRQLGIVSRRNPGDVVCISLVCRPRTLLRNGRSVSTRSRDVPTQPTVPLLLKTWRE